MQLLRVEKYSCLDLNNAAVLSSTMQLFRTQQCSISVAPASVERSSRSCAYAIKANNAGEEGDTSSLFLYSYLFPPYLPRCSTTPLIDLIKLHHVKIQYSELMPMFRGSFRSDMLFVRYNHRMCFSFPNHRI